MSGSCVAVAATFTAEPLKEPLEFFLRLLRWECTVEFAPFGQVLQTLLDPAGVFARNAGGINVMLAREEDLVRTGAVTEYAEAIRFAAKSFDAELLVRICPSATAGSAEELLGERIGAGSRAEVLRGAEQDAWYPVREVHDPKARAMGAIPYTTEYFTALGAFLARHMHAMRAAPYKVIALDCDDTLWSGVCGEEPLGVTLDAPREALQRFMAAQQAAGRMLAIVSKNNEEDVLETFQRHPEMPLQLDRFAARRINWDGKAVSLESLAAELRLGLDSFVFVDDNPKETAEVTAELPEVAALTLPADANRIPQFLEHVWALDPPRIRTREDRERTRFYAHEAERTSWAQQARSLEAFVAGLDLQVEIRPIKEEDVARAAQITQRTNQMNFTTRRRHEAEIRTFCERGVGLSVRVKDRFGDYGFVGLLLLEQNEEAVVVDTFALSCRALGRGVEHRMLRRAGKMAKESGKARVIVPFANSARNAPARDFLRGVADGEPPFHVEVEKLAGLVYRAADMIPRQVERNAEAAPRTQRAADYQRIAELRHPAEMMDAMLREKRERAPVMAAGGAPRTELEARLCALWSELLGVSSIGIRDPFFDVGGHSLLAVQMVSRIHRDIGVDLPLEAVYTGTLTVEELARSIELFQLGELNEDEYASLLAEVEGLSDAEAEALLASEMDEEPRV